LQEPATARNGLKIAGFFNSASVNGIKGIKSKKANTITPAIAVFRALVIIIHSCFQALVRHLL